jgi:hypothetical protein
VLSGMANPSHPRELRRPAVRASTPEGEGCSPLPQNTAGAGPLEPRERKEERCSNDKNTPYHHTKAG